MVLVMPGIYSVGLLIMAAESPAVGVVRESLRPRMLKVGAGMGGITQFLLNVEDLVCLEPYRINREFCADVSRHLGKVERFTCLATL